MMVLLGGLLISGPVRSQQGTALPPEARAWAQGAVEQLSVAIREAVFAWPASDLEELRLRAGRVLNVLVGHESPNYQGRLGDPPGADGVGVLTYLERLQGIIEPRAQEDERLRPLLFALDAIRFYADQSLEHLQDALQGKDLRFTQLTLRRALAFLISARGSSEDPLSEGGTRALLIQLNRL